MFFKKRKEAIEQKELELAAKEKKLDKYAGKLQEAYQSQMDLANLARKIGREVTSENFVTEVVITLSTRIGIVDVGLRVTMNPGKLKLGAETDGPRQDPKQE